MPTPLRSASSVRRQSVATSNRIPKPELWKKRLAEFEQSGLSVAQYCQSIGCSAVSFYQWRRKLRQPAGQSAFLQVQTEEQLSAAIELRLPGGISIFVPIHAISSLPHILQQVA